MFRQHKLSLVLILASALAGCASSSQDRPKAAVNSLKQTQGQIADVGKHIDTAMAALNSMQAGPDLEKKFGKFSSEVDAIDDDAKSVKKSAADMHARSKVYIAKWQSEMDTTTSPELKQAAAARRAAIQSRYGEITKAIDDSRDAYQTFYAGLASLRTYLANDLTAAGLQGAAPAIKKVNDDAAVMRQRIATARGLLSEVAGELTPGGVKK